MKLVVTFEAKNHEMMVEAVRSFLEEVQIGFSMREPHFKASEGFSLVTSDWLYDCKNLDETR